MIGVGNRDGREAAGAQRHAADRLIADVALVICVNQILRGPAPDTGGFLKVAPVGGAVEFKDGQAIERWIVDCPLESERLAGLLECSLVVGQDRIEDRAMIGAVDFDAFFF